MDNDFHKWSQWNAFVCFSFLHPARLLQIAGAMTFIKSVIKSFGYATAGIKRAFIDERNMKIHVVAALAAIVLGIWLELSKEEWLFVILGIGFVFSAELFNTSIEILCDVVSPEKHDAIEKVKDASAGAVLIAACAAAIGGGIIYFPKLIRFFLKNF